MIELHALHNPIAPHLAQAVRLFDAELASSLPCVAALVEQVARYRGKMLRPTLLLLSGQACGDLRHEHHVLAAVVEMVHVATLVHDDVLDDAEVRRRGPTINARHGNETAVLLGDYLISHAYHLCNSIGSPDASRRISSATNSVCEGELLQVHHRGNWDLDEATYLDIIRRKTAELTRVSCELGARLAGGDPDAVARLAAFGEQVGIAFQIVDDLLDITAAEHEMGKTLGRDAELAKPTLPVIHFLAHADAAARAELRRLMRDQRDPARPRHRALLQSAGSIDYATDMARAYIQAAVAELADLPPSDARTTLAAAAEFILRRRS